MGALTMGEMATELQRRITQLNATDALNALNYALAWVWRQGSYTFQLTGASPPITPVTNLVAGDVDFATAALPTDMDLGKAIFVANSPQGTPLEKRPLQDFSMSFGINIPANQGFQVYTISGRNLLCRPSQTSQQIGIRYHVNFQRHLDTAIPVTPPDFDEALIRLAEANERRIYDVGDNWPSLLKDAQADALALLAAYRSVSQEAMSAPDAAVAIQEKTQAGRA